MICIIKLSDLSETKRNMVEGPFILRKLEFVIILFVPFTVSFSEFMYITYETNFWKA